MASIFFYIVLLSLNSVNGFFYRAIPVLVKPIAQNNHKEFYVTCPWNEPHPDSECVITANHVGYQCKSSVTQLDMPLLNPNAQKCDVRGSVCSNSEKNKKLKTCAEHTNCVTVSLDHRLCSCGTGFFGDPYSLCHKHCEVDSDCASPFAHCTRPQTNALPRCACKAGYEGNGFFCYKNPCGQGDRLGKCPDSHVCVPTGPNSHECVCPAGHYVNSENKCVPNIQLKENTILSFHGTGVPDGSRIEAGDCLSFHLNEDTTSKFFHLNSGDPVYVKPKIKNEPEFYVAFVIRDEITAYARLKDDETKLTKLYALTNTSKTCSFGSIKVMDKDGNELKPVTSGQQKNLVKVQVRELTEKELANKPSDEL